jgi:hypothetical protein
VLLMFASLHSIELARLHQAELLGLVQHPARPRARAARAARASTAFASRRRSSERLDLAAWLAGLRPSGPGATCATC